MLKKPYALDIAEKTNYLNKNILYLKNTEITEYDITSAGFSVLKFQKLLSEEEIKEFSLFSKEKRNIKIGLKIRKNPLIGESIINTLTNVRKAFVILNHIYSEDILSIKKDAFFLIKKIPEKLIIKDFFQFKKKETYTSYLYLNKKEFYYNSFKNELEIKGLSEKTKNVQNNYFLNDIKNFLRSSEKLDGEQLFFYIKNYRKKYLNKELPLDTYRDIDAGGKFKIKTYYSENISEKEKDILDISQNYINYLLPIFNIIL
jgi:hypothetical protein